MSRRIFLLAIIMIVWLSAIAAGDPYRVIVNPSNPVSSISKPVLSKLLLKSQTTWSNGNTVLPVDLRLPSKPRDAISRSVHGRTARVIKNWWNQQIFAGKGVPPPELAGDAQVIAYVLAHPGAIGYVSADGNVRDVKVITVEE